MVSAKLIRSSFSRKTSCLTSNLCNFEDGFDQQRLIYGLSFICGIWCLADVSSVSPSSDPTKG